MLDAIDSIRRVGNQVRQIAPPSCLSEAHKQLLEVADRLDEVANNIGAGARSNDMAALLRAVTGMNESVTLMNKLPNAFAAATC